MILSKASVVRSPGRFGAGLRHLAAALAVVAFASGTASAQYEPVNYSFKGILAEGYDADEILVGEQQLGLTVTPLDDNYVSFTFTNTGTDTAVITGVYFYDGTLLENGEITSQIAVADGDVSFAENSEDKLGHLPGISEGNNPTAVFFSADPPNQPPFKGVNAGESLTITFHIIDLSPTGIAQDFGTVINALAIGNNDGGLVVGVHVQNILGPDGGSASFVAEVPEPASIAMLGFSSLVGIGYAWRKRGRVVA